MKRSIRTVVLTAMALTLSAGTAWVAHRRASEFKVTPDTHIETYDYRTGPNTSTHETVRRSVVHVPTQYGTLVHVTGSGSSTVLWFASGDTLRNVSVRGGNVLIRRGVLNYDETR